ncbi:MAG: TlpA family protein disulfide reductase [Planctomycetaceae bacterium]|nr:TlpA family protein disulfide reductase [Planctomycetaceae bacterium]
MHALNAAITTLLLASIAAPAIGEPPSKGKIVVPAGATTTVVPRTPQGAQAAPAAAPKEPDVIDETAKAVLDRATAAAKALKGIELVSTTSIKGDPAALQGLPANFGKPHRVSIVFQSKDEKHGRLSVAQLDGESVVRAMVEVRRDGGSDAILVDYAGKTFARADSMFEVGMDFLGELPIWIFDARAEGPEPAVQSGLPMSGPSKLVAAKMFGVEKINGEECDVIGLVREIDLGMGGMIEMEGDGAAEPGAPEMKETLRIKQLLAIARVDSLPRRMSMMPEMPGMPEDFEPPLTEYTAVKVNPEFPVDRFSTAAPEGFKETEAEQRMPGMAAEAPKLKVKEGDAAPDFALKDLAGAEVTLASLKGKVVLLDFWATWCGPCKMAMPTIQKLHDEYKDKGVVVLGVNTWEQQPDAARKYIEQKKFTYGCRFSGDALAEAYGVPGIPTLVVIGKDGKVAMAEVGLADSSGDSLRKAIDAALAK